MLTAQLAAQLLSSAFVFSLRLSWLGYILGCPSPHSFFSYLILRACPPCYFFHCFSVPVRAYPTSQPFSSVVEPDTCTSSDFETSPRLFFYFGTHPRIPLAFELVLQGCRFTLAGRLPKYTDHQTLNANDCMITFQKNA